MLTHSKPGCGEPMVDGEYLVHWFLGQEGRGEEEVCLYGLHKFTGSNKLCGNEVNPPYGRDYCERCMRKYGFIW